MEHPGGWKRTWQAAMALVAWGAVALQVFVSLTSYNLDHSVLYRLSDTLSYFTVLTNLLVAGVTTAALLHGEGGSWLSRPSTLSATVVYIFVVGFIYQLLLRSLWNPTGLQLIADVAMHSVIPVLLVFYWVLFVGKGVLRWADPLYWLAYPATYVAYTLARGAVTHFYPYPFGDVNTLGYPRALGNAGLLLTGFFGLGLLVVAIDRQMARMRAR